MLTLLMCYHFYADDSQLYKAVNPKCADDQIECKQHLESSISKISDWMFNNKLKLNQEKTEFIVFASKHNTRHIAVQDLTLNDTIIPRSDVVRNLGVYMDRELTMVRHINEVRKTCYYYMRWIWSVRHLLTVQATKYIVHALVMSRLDYCNTVLCALPQIAIRQLQRTQNAAARLVIRPPRDASITPILKQLHWLPIEYRIQYKTLCLVFKGLHDQAPQYIKDLLIPYQPTRRLRSSDSNLLSVPKTNMKYGQRAFSVVAPILWNATPTHVKDTQSYDVFRNRLKTHLFSVAFA